MLRDATADKRWGEIDLLGRSPEGWPVIIELKGASSNEPPLRGIVEGVEYAIAIRKAWGGCFANQWCDALKIGVPSECVVRTIFAAPSDYWKRVTGEMGPKCTVPKGAWQAISRLMQALAVQHLPVSLVRLDAEHPRAPKGIRASLLDISDLV